MNPHPYHNTKIYPTCLTIFTILIALCSPILSRHTNLFDLLLFYLMPLFMPMGVIKLVFGFQVIPIYILYIWLIITQC